MLATFNLSLITDTTSIICTQEEREYSTFFKLLTKFARATDPEYILQTYKSKAGTHTPIDFL